MSKIVERVSKIGKTLYEHKKKAAFVAFLGYLGADWVVKWNRNQNIRSAYAKQALQFGEKITNPDDRPRRVFVLVNVEGNSRNCFDDFNKNALPLFHLAGIQVDIMKAKNEHQLESLAGALDSQEADVVYIVGGDGTIGKVVTGVFRNRDRALLPIGIYPGGYDNLWLKRMVPTVFERTEDVRAACESAMAVIEDQKRDVYAFEMLTGESQEGPIYGLSDVGAGWFRSIEDTRKKFWYFSIIKRRWAYLWEMIKRSPEDVELTIEYENPCSGCSNCRPKVVFEAPAWRWWHVLTGSPRYKNTELQRDFSSVQNENCGVAQKIETKGTELIIENEQKEDYSQLRLRVGGTNAGRIGVIADGWKRCADGVVGRSPNADFYTTDIDAKSLTFRISNLPEYIRRLYISSAPTPKDSDVVDKPITIRGTQKKLEVFLPSAIRLEI
ncbi:unnamed protein product [Caenorhabditis bovis]|uniref:DAGKc domain-containing protein n=1 Tax=Caenorhabditis bovis TaxID=2654633 RepID=A0A8S1EUM8_9PELO|nr:unnamed protein product [Caenorhabditis bovis]